MAENLLRAAYRSKDGEIYRGGKIHIEGGIKRPLCKAVVSDKSFIEWIPAPQAPRPTCILCLKRQAHYSRVTSQTELNLE